MERGAEFRLVVPHKAFNRQIGPLAGVRISPQGRVVTGAEWEAHMREWLPTAEDRGFVQSLMGRVVEPGKFATGSHRHRPVSTASRSSGNTCDSTSAACCYRSGSGITVRTRRSRAASMLHAPAPAAAKNKKMKQYNTAGSPWFSDGDRKWP
jgi:hypothetical protein